MWNNRGNPKLSNKYIENNKGNFAVISAKTTNNGEYGYINSYDYLQGITISKDGYIGEIFYHSKPFSITTHTFKLKLIKNDILEKYLFYLLLKNSKKIKKISHGSTRPSLPKNKLKMFELFLPTENIFEQKQIIAIIEPL